jgi:hypothetical protein
MKLVYNKNNKTELQVLFLIWTKNSKNVQMKTFFCKYMYCA